MNIINKHIILILILGLSHGIAAQLNRGNYKGKNEIGLVFGGANYHGDLAPSIQLKETGLHAGLYWRNNRNSHISYRFQLCGGQISGTDENFSFNKRRNLSFNATVLEISGLVEFHFKKFGANFDDGNFSPYFATGLGAFYMDPLTTYNGNTYHLNQFETELNKNGKAKTVFPVQPVLPLVLGIKWSIKNNWILGTELGFRKTFTDYLDNTSNLYTDYDQLIADDKQTHAQLGHREQENGTPTIEKNMMRGDPHLKDWYIFAGFTIAYRFTPYLCPSM